MIPLKISHLILVTKTRFRTSGKQCSFLGLHKISMSDEWKRKQRMTHSASYIYITLLVSNKGGKNPTHGNMTNATVIDH